MSSFLSFFEGGCFIVVSYCENPRVACLSVFNWLRLPVVKFFFSLIGVKVVECSTWKEVADEFSYFGVNPEEWRK